MKKALILVDLQNDFCPGGALAVSGGDELIAIANTLQMHFECIVATQDWHPAGHLSFASSHVDKAPGDLIDLDGLSQVLWPDHCVQGTCGAELHPQLNTQNIQYIAQKGMDPTIDSYSAFFDNAHRRATGLGDWLQQHRVTDLYVMGLATDYCVRFTCLDAIALGFKVHLLQDACRGVELTPGDSESAFQEMLSVGVVSQSIKSFG